MNQRERNRDEHVVHHICVDCNNREAEWKCSCDIHQYMCEVCLSNHRRFLCHGGIRMLVTDKELEESRLNRLCMKYYIMASLILIFALILALKTGYSKQNDSECSTLKHASHVNGNLWVPFPDKHVIQVRTVDNEVISQITFTKYGNIYPRSALQINRRRILLASETGLYMVNLLGDIQYQVYNGNFTSIFYDTSMIVNAVSNKKIIKLECVNSAWQEQNIFSSFEALPNLAPKNNRADYTVTGSSYRMGFIDDKIWIPTPSTFSITVLNLDNVLVKNITFSDHPGLKPYSVKQACNSEIILSSTMGLHSVYSNGLIKYNISFGNFGDVSIDRCYTKAVGINYDTNKIHVIRYLEKKWTEIYIHTILHTKAGTISISNDLIYISAFWDHIIQKYDFQGNLLHTYGRKNNELGHDSLSLNVPYVCGVDGDGFVLICDMSNHRFVILSPNGDTWRSYNIDNIVNMKDVIIIGDTVYILWYSDELNSRRVSQYIMN